MIRDISGRCLVESFSLATQRVLKKMKTEKISSRSRRPGTNHRSKKMVKTPDLGKCLF